MIALAGNHLWQSTLVAEIGTESFASVSINANTSGDPGFYPMTMADGRFSMKNMPLRNLIANIYLRDGRLWGGPDWLDSDRFDIEARAEGIASGSQIRLMVRKLLADRWKALSFDTDDMKESERQSQGHGDTKICVSLCSL
jgi:uncharacterized protein (TIGR03435 family)